MKKKPTNTKPPPKTECPGVQTPLWFEKAVVGLRQSFVNRGPEAMKELSGTFDGPFARLLILLSEFPFTTLGSNRPKKSIQECLIILLKKSGAKDIEDQYKAALQSARALFFDTVTGHLLRFLPKEEDLSKALWRALLIQAPRMITKNNGAIGYVLEGIIGGGFPFLVKLVDDYRNYHERGLERACRDKKEAFGGNRAGTINDMMFVMAANWTNPHLPLWLMQTPAVLAAGRLLSPGSSWSLDAVNKAIERGKLTRKGRYNPIADLRGSMLGSKGFTLVLKGIEFDILDGQRFDTNFARPLVNCPDSEVTSKAIIFEDARRAMNRIKKSEGEDSAEYDDALAEMVAHFNLTSVAPSKYRIEVQRKSPTKGR